MSKKACEDASKIAIKFDKWHGRSKIMDNRSSPETIPTKNLVKSIHRISVID